MLKMFVRDDGRVHPLTDPKERKRLLGELPKDEAQALDELSGWMESLLFAEGLAPPEYFEVVRQVDEAAQPLARHLTQAFLIADQRARADEARLWKLLSSYWWQTAEAYRLVIDGALDAERRKQRSVDAMKPLWPLLVARRLAALNACAKWKRFHHERPSANVWGELGRTFMLAEARRLDEQALILYPFASAPTTPRREYLKALALEASSLDSLLPAQIEVAGRLVAHFSPLFAFGRDSRSDNLCWIDTTQDAPPQRLTRLPPDAPGVRLLGLGEVPAALAEIRREVERGQVPANLNLGGDYAPRLVLAVLRHLGAYWASKPPTRRHSRHATEGCLMVAHGFDEVFSRVGGMASEADGPAADDLDFCGTADCWRMGDISLGGLGAAVPGGTPRQWLRVGVLLAMQPDGRGRWMIGWVRRYQKNSDGTATVGIQTVARQGEPMSLTVLEGIGRTEMRERAVLIDPDMVQRGEGEVTVRLLLPPATFDLRESYGGVFDQRRVLLTPVELLAASESCQIGSFRLRYAD